MRNFTAHNTYFSPIKTRNEDNNASPPTSEGGHDVCDYQRFVRNRTGESTLSQTRLRDDVTGDIQRKGWGGEGVGGYRGLNREGRSVPL